MNDNAAIRLEAFRAAMELSTDENPFQSMVHILAMTHTMQTYLETGMLPEQKAEAPADANPNTGEDKLAGLTASEAVAAERAKDAEFLDWAQGETVVVDTAIHAAAAELKETVARARAKPKAKKAKAAKKTKPSREPVREEVGTASQESGNQVPANEDPVPGEQLQAAA